MTSEAYRNGWLAHAKKHPAEGNPYDEKAQPYSHAQWTSGWCGRFSAVKHDQWEESDDFKMEEGKD